MTDVVPGTAVATRRLDGLDLLRGVAVALVMLRHALPQVFAGAGVVGVVMFFTLSGYLITGVLCRERARCGAVDLRRFYAGRAVRLLPALLVLLVAVAAVSLALDPLGDRARLGRTIAVALTWTANLPGTHASAATFHLWTLATEEQFYLVWPWVLALAARRAAGRVLALAAGVCLLGCAATLLWLREAPDLAYALPTSWAVCFVIGATTWWYREGFSRWLGPPGPWAWMALAVLGVLSVVALRGSAATYLIGGPVIAMSSAVLLLTWGTRARVSCIPARPLVALGVVSYAAYLWNYPLTLWLRPSWGGEAGPIAAVLTLLAAAMSWHLVEKPVAQWWRSRNAPGSTPGSTPGSAP
ncbi:MAG TPA: acyltransferase [Nocardioides sp.]|nr:acyltransferase [Nocardioides sp.]